MNIYKRAGSLILSLLLVFSLLSSTLAVQTYAATAPALSAESKSVSVGDQFTVAVNLANATSVYGGNFTLQYDSNLLTADSYTFGSIVGSHTKNCNLNYQSAGNLIRFTFSGASALTSSGTLVTFTFTAKQSVSGSAALQFTAYKMYDENGSAITSTASSATITISSKPVVSPSISITNKTVTVGETVSVPVMISNSSDVYGGNFTLQYDNSLLTAESYSFGSIVSGHTKNCNLDYQSAGNLIRVTFSGASAVSSDGTLVTFTFTAKAAGTATLQFTAYKMYDENGSSIATTISNGKVIVEENADTTKPTVSITSTNNAATSQTVTLKMSDNVGVVSYYWGTSSSPSSSSYTSISSTTSKTVTKTVSSAGIYYLYAKDAAGNIGSTSVTFYKTTLNANSGSVSPSYVITKSGNTVTLPTPTNVDATFIGWGTSYTATSGVKTITVSSSKTLYAVWEPNVVLSSISLYSKPSKTVYYIGDSLNTTGLVLRLTYSDGSAETVSSGFTTSGFSSTTAGTKTVTVSYAGKTTTFDVTVNTPSVSLSSTSKSMTAGDTATLTATTTPSGQTVTWTSSNTNVATVSGGKIIAKASGSATITAKFTYNGITYSKTCSITVTPAPSPEPTLSSVSIATKPTKTSYEIGEPLNTSGLTLKLTYSDGSTETVSSGFTTSGFSSATTGTKTVTVSYGGKTTTFTVTVNEPEPDIDENSPTIVVDTVTGRAGETVVVTVSIKNNIGFGGMAYDVKFDETTLELVSYEIELGSGICTDSGLGTYSDKVNFQYAGTSNITGDGVLVSFTFKIKENAPEGYSKITVIPEDGTFFTYEGRTEKDFDVSCLTGGVEIVTYISGDINGDGKVNNRDAARLLQKLAGWDVDYVEAALDVNGDGKVNNRDAARILQYLAGWDVELF